MKWVLKLRKYIPKSLRNIKWVNKKSIQIFLRIDECLILGIMVESEGLEPSSKPRELMLSTRLDLIIFRC